MEILNRFKKWAYEVPKYDSPTWDKVDSVIDGSMAVTTENTVSLKVFNYIDKKLMQLNSIPNPKWLQKWDTSRKD